MNILFKAAWFWTRWHRPERRPAARHIAAWGTAILGLLLIVPALAAVWLLLAHSARNEAAASALATARVASHVFDNDIATRTATLTIAAKLAERDELWNQPKQLHDRLSAIESVNPSIPWIGFADRSGRVVAAARDLAVGLDVREREWFQQGSKALFHGDVRPALKLATVLPPTPTGEPHRFLDIAMPLRDRAGEVRGVLALHLSWHWLRDLVERATHTLPAGSELWLVGPDGRRRNGEGFDEPLALEALKAAASGAAGTTVERWPDGKTYVTAYAPTAGGAAFLGLGWVAVVRVPAKGLPASELVIWQWMALASGVLLALTTLLASYMTRLWLKPLARFEAEVIAIGDSNRPPSLPAWMPEEFNGLEQAVQRLLGELRLKEHLLRKALQELEMSLAMVGARLPGILATADLREGQLTFRYLNTAADRYLGMADPEDAGPDRRAGWMHRIHPDDLAVLRDDLRALEQGTQGVASTSLRFREPDGAIRTLHSTMMRREVPVGCRIDWIALDISEVVAARASAERAHAAKSHFLNLIGKEIRTPLTAMIGHARVVEDRSADDATRRQAHFISETGEMLTRMLRDVVDVLDMEAGRFELSPQVFRLADVLEQVKATYRVAASQKGLSFHVASPADLPDLLGDPMRLRQMLEHLLNNAVKHTAAGAVALRATVSQQTRLSDGRLEVTLQIRVTDTGAGMTPESLERAFTIRQRDDAGQDVPGAGAGVGLAICKGLASAMGGSIAATSVPGNGSQFTLTLAFLASQDLLALPQPPLPALTVLVADDLPMIRHVVRTALQGLGHHVIDSNDLAQAIALAHEHLPDLVLIDTGLPGMDLAQAVRQIRGAFTQGAQLPVVGLMPHTHLLDKAAADAAGLTATLAKPLRPDALASLLQGLRQSAPFFGAQRT